MSRHVHACCRATKRLARSAWSRCRWELFGSDDVDVNRQWEDDGGELEDGGEELQGTWREKRALLAHGTKTPSSKAPAEPPIGNVDRAFIIAHHPRHGYLVLFSNKQRKGEHGQLPGGRLEAGETGSAGALRELHEETGMKLDPRRLHFFKDIATKRYFLLDLIDADGFDDDDVTASPPRTGEPFRLKLSDEHTGFAFFKEREAATRSVVLHSAGHGAAALAELGRLHKQEQEQDSHHQERHDDGENDEHPSHENSERGNGGASAPKHETMVKALEVVAQ